jgi:hypothetical protein
MCSQCTRQHQAGLERCVLGPTGGPTDTDDVAPATEELRLPQVLLLLSPDVVLDQVHGPSPLWLLVCSAGVVLC